MGARRPGPSPAEAGHREFPGGFALDGTGPIIEPVGVRGAPGAQDGIVSIMRNEEAGGSAGAVGGVGTLSSFRPVTVAAAALAMLIAAVSPGNVDAAGPRLQPLVRKARASGTVRVLAELRAPDSASVADSPEGREASLHRLIADLGATGWSLDREFETVPFVALELSADAVEALAASGAVGQVVEDRLESVSLGTSAPLVQADRAWAAGFDGSGWTIAVLDTGVQSSHPFLAGKVVAQACFSANGSCPNGTRTQFGPGAGEPCSFASSACVHGTHMAGIAAGRGNAFSGIARGASIISVQVFSRFTGSSTCAGEREDPCAKSYTSDTIAAMEWLYRMRDTYRIAAVNMSLGGGRYSSQQLCDADDAARKQIIATLRSAGIATVAASGNEGYSDSTSAPGCISGVVSVGATNREDRVASFSNSASFLSLLAPGVQIQSSIPTSAYALLSGTSPATPHVAGAFAILAQALDQGDVDRSLAALRSSGVPVEDPRNGVVVPRIRIRDALDALVATPSGSGLQVTPDERHTLISKDVGGERWAISTTGGTSIVTGNVYQPDGAAPVFLYCVRTGSDGNPDPLAEQIDFSCSIAGDCTSSSCPDGQWSPAGEVTLPGSFFLPRATAGGIGASGEAAAAAPPAAAPPSALQVTPDRATTLVSKDVGGQRWSISRDAIDGAVTGNVYTPGGGLPQFVSCALLGTDGNPDPAAVELTYSCSVAPRCTGVTCPGNDWAFFSVVTLPGSFFLPR